MAFALEFHPFPSVGGPLASASVPWDTDLYGILFYELRCEGLAEDVHRTLPSLLEAIQRKAERQAALVFTRIQPSDVRLVEVLCASGFYPSEMTLQISMPLRRFKRLHPSRGERVRLRRAEAGDVSSIVAIAASTFSTDRFHLDPHLPQNLSDTRYAQWIERGFREDGLVFVYERVDEHDANSEIIGFYLVRGEPGGEVDLSLAGMDVRYRRSGLGVLMYEDMLDLCREMGFRVATTAVSTNNPDVVNLFMGLGFVIRSARMTLHRFISPSQAEAT